MYDHHEIMDGTRSPLWAGFLSLAATGLGHIYCGKIEKGLVLFFISFVFAPIISSSMTQGTSSFSLAAVIGSVLILVFVFFYALIDAVITAKKINKPYTLKEYNRWYIYLAFIIVSVTYPTNLANTIRDHVVQAYKIPSNSMVPGILKHDFVLINKAVYRKHSPEVGDVVIFINPNKRHLDFMKRIVAMPGDTLEIKNNVVFINDSPLGYRDANDDALKALGKQVDGTVIIEINGSATYGIMLTQDKMPDFQKTKIPNGHCFVLGDNRNNSQDSRKFGPVPLCDIKGRVESIYLPAESWSRFGSYKDLH
ncbi:MAG: signal peptidase I [Proteobacteria bacterium]|nr:signal peptidase I [Pseudomonadota bacterium]